MNLNDAVTAMFRDDLPCPFCRNSLRKAFGQEFIALVALGFAARILAVVAIIAAAVWFSGYLVQHLAWVP